MRSSRSSATTPPLEGGSSCAVKGGAKRASEIRRMEATGRKCRRTDPAVSKVRLEANSVGLTMSLWCIPQRSVAAGSAELGVPIPEVQPHAQRSEGIGYNHSPKWEQLVGPLGENLQQAIKQYLEHEEHRQQSVADDGIPRSPVDQDHEPHAQQREHRKMERGVDQDGSEHQVTRVRGRVTEQHDLPQETGCLKRMTGDGIEEQKPGCDS